MALLSISALSLLDDRLTLARVVRALADRGASALAVVGDPPPDARTASDEQAFPLFALPAVTDLRDIERDIIRLIVEHEAQIDRRRQDIYQQLTQVSIENGGLPAIADALVAITGKPVVVQNERLDIEAMVWPKHMGPASEATSAALSNDTALRDWIQDIHLGGRSTTRARFPLADAEWARSVVGIVIEGAPAGYITLLGKGDLDDLDDLSLEQAALVCAVEIAKQRAVAGAEDRMRGDFLDSLLTARSAQEPALARRSLELGYRLSGFHRAVVFKVAPMATQALALLASEFGARLRETDTLTFLCPHEGNLVALCNADDAVALRQLEDVARDTKARTLERFALGAPGRSVAIGIGGAAAGLEGLRRSLSQACEALSLAEELFGGDRVLSYSDLGVYALLCRVQDGEEMAAFYEQTIAPLVRYDTNHNTRLVETLEAFFAHLGNVSQTAESLHLHRNSLLYRLERISEITRLDPNDADDRFSLQLALRLLPLVERPNRPS